MKDTVFAILLILVFMVGLPVLILWLRDRGGSAGSAARKALGAASLFMGLTITGWAVFNLFSPIEGFRLQWYGFIHLFVLIGMVFFGWQWLAGPGIDEAGIDPFCDEVRKSVSKAEATLPWFLEQVEINAEGALVRFTMEMPGKLRAYVWARVYRYQDDGYFQVALTGDSARMVGKSTRKRKVGLHQILDWQIAYPDGRVRGAYSYIALFEHYEAQGKKLTRKMRKQKALLIDAQ